MSIIPQVTCRKCRAKYSRFNSRCPQCGAKRLKSSTRTAPVTNEAVPGTDENRRGDGDNKLRLIFGGVIIAAIVIAVIVLVSVSLNRTDVQNSAIQAQKETVANQTTTNTTDAADTTDNTGAAANNTDSAASGTDTAGTQGASSGGDTTGTTAGDTAGTTTGSDTAQTATSVTIYYYSSAKTEFTASSGETVQLSAKAYPENSSQTIKWSSQNDSVATVDSTGLVTGVGSGNTYVIAECGGVQAKCYVIIS